MRISLTNIVIVSVVAIYCSTLSIKSAVAQATSPGLTDQTNSKVVPAEVSEKTKAIKILNNIIINMGFDISESTDEYIVFSQKNVSYSISASDDGQYAYLSTWWDVPKEKLSKAPFEKMLRWNDSNAAYFGLGDKNNEKNKGYYISLQARISTKNISAVTIREALDLIDASVNDNMDLMDITKWN